jgi:hypothetical protein
MSERWVCLLLSLCLLVSCSSDEFESDSNAAWKAAVTSGEELDAEQHYHTVEIEIAGLAAGSVVGLTTDADWLTITSDTLPADGKFDVLPEQNTDA